VDVLDQELIEQLLSNTLAIRRKGWDFVYKTCYPSIKEMVRKHSGSDDDAFDVFQDGMAVLYNNLVNNSYRDGSNLNAYIYGICKNLWLKEYNRKYRQAVIEEELIIETRQNFDYLIDVEIITLLMNELGEDCRRILTEYYFNNRSMAELKEIFNVNSVQAAKNKKWRCLNYLEKLFKEKGITPTWS
jgi:RNA polymerase sigma factor (sigma-70 family)